MPGRLFQEWHRLRCHFFARSHIYHQAGLLSESVSVFTLGQARPREGPELISRLLP